MTFKEAERQDYRLFSFGGYLRDKEQWGEWLSSREVYTLEDLLEPFRLQ